MKIADTEVAKVFRVYPKKLRDPLLDIRKLIYKVAKETEGVGELVETLKWGQPSYLTPKTKSGSTIRLGLPKIDGQVATEHYAIFFHCQTTLVATFKEVYGSLFEYEGNRAVLFHQSAKLPKKELEHCIYLALTYHLR